MSKRIRKIVCMMICLTMLMSLFATQVYAAEDFGKENASVASESIDLKGSTAGNVISPHAFIGYEYVPGYERLVDKKYDYKFGYIYGTSIYFSEGATVTYTLTVKRSHTRSTSWNIRADFEGSVSVASIKAGLTASGGYSSTNTATVEVGETWSTAMEQPGVYDLAWYMRGHKYYAQCGSRIVSTGADHGNFMYCTLGTVTFPTDEVYFEAIRNDTY